MIFTPAPPAPGLPPPGLQPGARPGVHSACVFSPNASEVWLCHFDDQGIEQRVPLSQRRGPWWFGYVQGLKPGTRYGFRAAGAPVAGTPAAGAPVAGTQALNPHKLLLDPWARCHCTTVQWHPALSLAPEQQQVDSAAYLPGSRVPAHDDPAGTHIRPGPQIDPRDRVLYELHVKGFTQLHPEVPEALRGTYLGLASAPVLEYLQTLGVTTLQLMPCMAFMTEARLQRLGLANYWGYNPVSFFAPDWRYAINDPETEFRQMIDALHGSGFEVILDVVYNHTAEGGEVDGSHFCLRGFSAQAAYRFNAHGGHQDDSGCGNSVQSEHPWMRQMILDSLRHWRLNMGLDGFRFDLAASLGRQYGPFKPEASLLASLREDPVLRHALLIAEPWDIGTEGYQLGGFPQPLHEVNDRFRDDLRAFWRGDPVGVGQLATRLMGSRDVFSRKARAATDSVNLITCHDGFTLHDLVSYERRHNEANGEKNRDGHGHNLSCNHGIEGPTQDLQVLGLRLQHCKNLLTCLLLSRGTPHLLAGDERAHSQGGNNNAYCQDCEINWLKWKDDSFSRSLLEFVQALLQLRRKSFGLNRYGLPDEQWFGENISQVHWLNRELQTLDPQQWQDPHNAFLALLVTSEGAVSPAYLWVINRTSSTHQLDLSGLPGVSADPWCLQVDSGSPAARLEGSILNLSGFSIVVVCQSASEAT